MRRVSILFPLLLAVCAHAQTRPQWPQPIVHGALIVWGGDAARADARAAFLQTARAGGKVLVLPGEGEDWSNVAQATVVARLEPSEATTAAGIWVGTPQVPSDVRSALEAAKERGAVVALSAEAWRADDALDLLGQARIESAGSDNERQSAISVSLPETAVLVANGRLLSARGEGEVVFTVAQSEKVVVDARNRADLIALERRAIERSLTKFPGDKPAVPEVKSGTLFIVGGGGMPAGLLERFIAACGGPDAPIVYVPCEFAEQIAQEPSFVNELRKAGAKNVSWIHTKDRNKADKDDEFLKPLKEAKGVWFGGGRQWNLVDSYMDTQAHDLMRQVLERGGAIGGSSAGASIQAELLARGDPLGNTDIIAPGYLRGLGFLPGAAVDQHFTQRDRFKDMTSLMKAYPQWLGIGIDEATAIVVTGTTAEVAGRGSVHFYDYRTPPTGDVDYLKLKAGDKYDLRERKRLEG